jgi:hypothetical protein
MQDAVSFTEIRIESHPKEGGYADKAVKRDGAMSGHHMSGDAPPRVYRSENRMTKKDMNAVLSLLAEVRGKDLAGDSAPLENGYTCVVISCDDASVVTFSARWGQEFATASIQAIWELLYKYDVGAW